VPETAGKNQLADAKTFGTIVLHHLQLECQKKPLQIKQWRLHIDWCFITDSYRQIDFKVIFFHYVKPKKNIYLQPK